LIKWENYYIIRVEDNMELALVQMEKSKGIRIPENILIKYNFKDKVVVDLKEDGLLIKSKKVREGWAESFKEMAKNGDDELILGDF
jgi:antitoxin component of MazEF toxin-antitoxin module